MERKIDECEKSQNISSEQTNWTVPQPPPQAHPEQVNAVFTRNGKTNDSPKIQKDPPFPIIVNNKSKKDKPIKTAKRDYHVVKSNEYPFLFGLQKQLKELGDSVVRSRYFRSRLDFVSRHSYAGVSSGYPTVLLVALIVLSRVLVDATMVVENGLTKTSMITHLRSPTLQDMYGGFTLTLLDRLLSKGLRTVKSIPPKSRLGFSRVLKGALDKLLRETLAEPALSLSDTLEEDLESNERNIKKCKRKICDGHYTAAIRVLSSSGLVLDMIKSFPRGTSCGRDGLRAQHLMDCLSGAAVAMSDELNRFYHPGGESILDGNALRCWDRSDDIRSFNVLVDFKNASFGGPEAIYRSPHRVQQGDPLGPLLFALVLHPLICKIKDSFSLSLHAWYLDDGTIVGDTLVVGKVLELIMEDGPRRGLHLNIDKTEVFWPREDPRSRLVGVFPPSIARPLHGVKLLGGPVSVDFDFNSGLVLKRVSKSIELMDVIAKLNDPQCELLLLRACAGISKLYFAMRTCSPQIGNGVHGLDEPTQAILDETDGGIFLYKSPNQAFQFLEDKVLFEHENEHHQKSVSFTDGSDSNTDNSRFVEKLKAMDSQIISLNEELQDMHEKYNELRNGNASKNHLNDDTPMCERREANYIQSEDYQNRNSYDSFSHQSLHDPNDSKKSLTELNNDVRNDLEDFKRLSNMFVKNNINDMILKMKPNEKNFQTKIKKMERKMDEWSKSQNIYSEQTDRTEPQPPPQAQTEHVSAVFTGSGKSDDSLKNQKDPPPITVNKKN
ncbi:putative reverse transcriptase domain-containing protein [Tanacetum coccineum]